MITLRPLHPKDDFPLFQLLSDPLVTEKLPDTDHIHSLAEARQTLQQMIEDTHKKRRFCQAIVRADDDTLIGTMIANNINPYVQSAYIAYELHPRYWGKGIMFDALKSFIPMIQQKFSHKKIKAQTTVDNHRSQGLLKKLGFLKEKEFPYPKPVNGQYIRACLYSLDLPSKIFSTQFSVDRSDFSFSSNT